MYGLFSLFDRVVATWAAWMASMIWQAAVLFVVLAIVGFLLRNRSARFRYSLWTLMPIRLLLPPSLALVTGWAWWLLPSQPTLSDQLAANRPRARASGETAEFVPAGSAFSRADKPHAVLPLVVDPLQDRIMRSTFPASEPSDVAAAEEFLATTDRLTSTGGSLNRQPNTVRGFDLRLIRNVAFLVWLSIASLLSLRLLIGYRRVCRWVAESAPADETTQALLDESCKQLGIQARVNVRVSFSVWTPLVTGLFRSVILVPPAVLLSLNSRELKAVLLHELQHVVRRDFLQECVFVLVQILYFFHPCVWLANRQLRRLREQACDEATIAILGGQRQEYGAGFVKVAELLAKPTPQLTFGIVDSGESPASRLGRILDPKLRVGRGVSRSGLALIVLLGLILIPSAARRPLMAESPKESTQTQAPTPKPESAPSKELVVEETKPVQTNVVEIPTIGDSNVEPYEIQGQVLGTDKKPVPKAVIRITWNSVKSLTESTSITTGDDGRFRIRTLLKKEVLPQIKVMTVSPDNSQIAAYRFPWDADKNADIAPITIQLAPARVVRLKVVDKSGSPIDKAKTVVQLTYPGKTDPIETSNEGLAQFVIPANERINSVVAWKDNAGLDYRLYQLGRDQKADANAKAPEFPDTGIETLILDGASPVTVKIMADDGELLKNVIIYPWLLKKESESDQLNLSFFPELQRRTNDEGIATFAWIPSWQSERITFWPATKGYDRERAMFDPRKDGGRLEITLKKLIPIRGHVYDKNGAPVAGANVAAVGASYTFDRSQAAAHTDKDGAYELLVATDQIYLVVASAQGMASSPRTGFAVLKGKPVEDQDFTLRAATRVHGMLVDEESNQPIAGENVHVYQYGQDLHSIRDVKLPNPEGSNVYVQPIMTYHVKSDEKGQFELFVGDGQFDIRPPRQEKVEKFQVTGESEREFVVKTKVSKEMELTGTVKDQATNLALAKATVFGVSRSNGGRDWQATTNQDGEFRVKQVPAATYVHAVSADKKLGAIIEVEAKQPSTTLSLQPVGTARGRLLKTGTKEPWSGQGVNFGVRVPSADDQTWSNRFGGHTTTAADGTFELVGLVPGWKYDLSMDSRSNGTIPSLGKVLVQPGEAAELGDVSPPPPPKPYVPPTLEERIAGAFNVSGTATERYVKSKDLVSLVNQHLLIVFGNPDDRRIRSLMKIRFEDKDYQSLGDEFRVMAIPTSAKARAEADKLASELRESLEGDRSEFLLVLLDSTGKKVDQVPADQMTADGQFSKEKLLDWLRKHQPEPKNARKVLDEALAAAKQQNKRVLVQETATWCGPCHRLAQFLMANRVWEKDYIWVKMDHRYTGAAELMTELRDKADGGIPWCAILDSNGKKLATSNDLKSKQNIGFPTTKSDQVHFEHMLKSTRLQLTDAEISGLVQALTIEGE